MKLLISLAVLSSLLAAFATTPEQAQVISDVINISSQVATLHQWIKALKTSSDSTGTWDIHIVMRSVLVAINTATDNAKIVESSLVSRNYEEDALSASYGLADIIVEFLNDIVTQRIIISAFAEQGMTALIRRDLLDLKITSQNLQDVILAGASGDTRLASLSIIDTVNQAFELAIATYS
ncbi:hypothetical protein BJ165DRAFT_1613319 [Panaeolus papilionaceus]|nr:hypothetical protein BJ165DRAFT_1613319 [Panaeolus papilionaceus]